MNRLAFRACMSIFLGLLARESMPFDFRTLNYVTDPVTESAYADSSNQASAKPLPQGWDFESGIISSPTAFSFDLPTSVSGIQTHPHLSFFLCPGIRVAYRTGRMDHALNLIYRGAFDFYYGSMTSGPVLSRLQNPEFYHEFEYATGSRLWSRIAFRTGLGHESNGMFVVSQEQYDNMRKTLPPDYDAQDFASMGWNYWQLETDMDFAFGGYRFKPHLGIRLYTNQDDMFNFNDLEDTTLYYPGAGRARYEDYDGLVFLFPLEVPMDFWFLRWPPLSWFPWSYGAMVAGIQTAGLQTSSPQNWIRHATYHFALKGRWLHLPWLGFLKYEYGFTDPIAYFPVRSHRFSMGIEFKNYRFGK